MPLYEFRCPRCEAITEALVPVGTAGVACESCGHEPAARVLSAPAGAMRLVKTPGAARKQEARNAKLHAVTKAKFKEGRRKAREAKKRGGGSRGA